MSAVGKRPRSTQGPKSIAIVSHAGTSKEKLDSRRVGEKSPGMPTSSSSLTKTAPASDPFDIDGLFASAATQKAKVAAESAAFVLKAEKKKKKAVAAESAAAALIKDLEVAGRKANRIKGADSPVPLR